MTDRPQPPGPLTAAELYDLEAKLERGDWNDLDVHAVVDSYRGLLAAYDAMTRERDERLRQLLYTREERDTNYRLLEAAQDRAAVNADTAERALAEVGTLRQALAALTDQAIQTDNGYWRCVICRAGGAGTHEPEEIIHDPNCAEPPARAALAALGGGKATT